MSEKPQNLPDVPKQQEISKKPFSPENQAKQYAEKATKPVKETIKTNLKKSPELKSYTETKDAELKAILEGKESKEKSPENLDRKEILKSLDTKIAKTLPKGQDIDKIAKLIKKPDGSKFDTSEDAKEFLREQFLKGEIKEFKKENVDKNGKTIPSKREKLLEKTPFLKNLDGKLLDEAAVIYGEDAMKDFEELVKNRKEEGKDMPKNLKDLNELFKIIEIKNNDKDEKNEGIKSKENTIKGKIINKRTNKNGDEIPLNTPLENGTTLTTSYNGNSYKTTGVISENVNVSNIDSEIKSLSKVKNLPEDLVLLEGKGLSEHNKELIFNRIPKEWFDVAVAFALKEGKDIKKDTPISLASRSKKVGVISYPNGTSEETSVITADRNRNPPKTDIMDTVFHFGGVKIAGINKSAALSYNSKTTLGASIQSPEGQAEGGKWWHGVTNSRFPNGKTFGCVGIRQEIAIRLARSVQNSGSGYGYLVQ